MTYIWQRPLPSLVPEVAANISDLLHSEREDGEFDDKLRATANDEFGFLQSQVLGLGAATHISQRPLPSLGPEVAAKCVGFAPVRKKQKIDGEFDDKLRVTANDEFGFLQSQVLVLRAVTPIWQRPLPSLVPEMAAKCIAFAPVGERR